MEEKMEIPEEHSKSQFVNLNEKGNKHRTSDDEILKSQIATSSWGGKRKVYNKRQGEMI